MDAHKGTDFVLENGEKVENGEEHERENVDNEPGDDRDPDGVEIRSHVITTVVVRDIKTVIIAGSILVDDRIRSSHMRGRRRRIWPPIMRVAKGSGNFNEPFTVRFSTLTGAVWRDESDDDTVGVVDTEEEENDSCDECEEGGDHAKDGLSLLNLAVSHR